MNQEHPRCIVYKPIIIAFSSEGLKYLGVVYDAGDRATEAAMRAACALFGRSSSRYAKSLGTVDTRRLAIVLLDETHGG